VRLRTSVLTTAALLFFGVLTSSAQAGDVAIFTGKIGWMSTGAATAQAQICIDKLTAWGIAATLFPVTTDATNVLPDQDDLATWVTAHTNNGQVDVVVLFGAFPTSIYPGGNASPDNSIAELFIESTDGDAIMNFGDAMFYVSTGTNNGYAGLQNMMDNTTITQANDNTPMKVTAAGKAISSSLMDYWADRMFFPSQLVGEWVVEAALGVNYDGTRVSPAIFRDGPRGRLIYPYGTNTQDWDPKGAVAAEISSWVMGASRGAATAVGFSGGRTMVVATDDPRQAVWAGEALTVTVNLLEATGSSTAAAADTTVDLTTDSTTGAFDLAAGGAFDGSVNSVTIPAGATCVDVFYKDSATATITPTLTASSAGLAAGTRLVKVFPRSFAPMGDVAIYTGKVGWVSKAVADAQAQITASKLGILGITPTLFPLDTDGPAVQSWVQARTGNGKLDVLVLYGVFPADIYPAANALRDGSPAELFIETTDGDAIMNHGDAMFYVTSSGSNNGYNGLMNMMDTIYQIGATVYSGFLQSAGWINTVVTPAGAEIAPSLYNYRSERPFCVDMLISSWLVEAALAQNVSGGRWGVDPVIIRDGDRGRIIPALQRSDDSLPKGAVAADIISWLYGYEPADPVQFAIAGRAVGGANQPIRFEAQVQGLTGSPAKATVNTTVDLTTDSATGAFDISPVGSFDGSVTSVTIPAGSPSAVFYYKDTAAGTPIMTASATGFTSDSQQVTVIGRIPNPMGEVAIYTGKTWWISKAAADVEAQILSARLGYADITSKIFPSDSDQAALAAWVSQKTNNGWMDVLVIYGCFPRSIYPTGNTQANGSIAELFIESTDGDVIINSGDWMFYTDYDGADARLENGAAALQNMMDTAGIGMGADDTPVFATAEGMAIAPSLRDFLTDRPFFPAQLSGNWYVEAGLAWSADGTRAEPAIVRDGDRGRLVALFQTNMMDVNTPGDPKGAVAAEVIAWLADAELAPAKIGLSNDGGAAIALTRTPMKVNVTLLDAAGVATPDAGPVTVTLGSSSAYGVFDLAKDGAFDGSVTSVTIPAGSSSAVVYFRDKAEGSVTLTATAPLLADGSLVVKVEEAVPAVPGSVVIYTGTLSWIGKAAADAQAQICASALTAAGIANTVYPNAADVDAVATWMNSAINNGKTDVLVLYGSFPDTIYPPNNAQVDNSLAEFFIETNDGDTIINHADWMFYVFSSGCCNGPLGLESMMDVPSFDLSGDNTPMYVTAEGSEITPSLVNFWTDRAFRKELLGGEWFVEAALAESSFGQRMDPTIVRDGNRGRLVPALQAADQNDPKGAVAAEIIQYLMTNVPGQPVRKPTNLVATIGTASIDLAWDAPTKGTPPEAFVIYRDGYKLAEVLPAVTTFTDEEVENGIEYCYEVASKLGPDQEKTAKVCATIPNPMQAPVDLTVTPGTGAIDLAWSPPAGGPAPEAYVIYRNNVALGEVAAPATSYSDATVEEVTEYCYEVAAKKGTEEAKSVKLCATLPTTTTFVRGDVNNDKARDITDPIAFLEWRYLGKPAPVCEAACDMNGDGELDLSDAIHDMTFQFLGGPKPAGAYPGCEVFPGCPKQDWCPEGYVKP
jgi:hypothetical protein